VHWDARLAPGRSQGRDTARQAIISFQMKWGRDRPGQGARRRGV